MSIDRDGVIAILTGLASETADVEGAADRILALARPASHPSIDRGALRRILEDVAAARGGESEPQSYDDGIDAVLALVRPVEGVTLSREEVRLVLRWQEFAEMDAGVLPGEAEQALLARLGADNAEASR